MCSTSMQLRCKKDGAQEGCDARKMRHIIDACPEAGTEMMAAGYRQIPEHRL